MKTNYTKLILSFSVVLMFVLTSCGSDKAVETPAAAAGTNSTDTAAESLPVVLKSSISLGSAVGLVAVTPEVTSSGALSGSLVMGASSSTDNTPSTNLKTIASNGIASNIDLSDEGTLKIIRVKTVGDWLLLQTNEPWETATKVVESGVEVDCPIIAVYKVTGAMKCLNFQYYYTGWIGEDSIVAPIASGNVVYLYGYDMRNGYILGINKVSATASGITMTSAYLASCLPELKAMHMNASGDLLITTQDCTDANAINDVSRVKMISANGSLLEVGSTVSGYGQKTVYYPNNKKFDAIIEGAINTADADNFYYITPDQKLVKLTKNGSSFQTSTYDVDAGIALMKAGEDILSYTGSSFKRFEAGSFTAVAMPLAFISVESEFTPIGNFLNVKLPTKVMLQYSATTHAFTTIDLSATYTLDTVSGNNAGLTGITGTKNSTGKNVIGLINAGDTVVSTEIIVDTAILSFKVLN